MPVPRFNKYKPPRIVKGKRWYVEYWYKVPPELSEAYKGKEWERFREFKDLNKLRTDEYAEWLLNDITASLDSGWSPFDLEKKLVTQKKAIPKLSLATGLQRFIEEAKEKGLRTKSVQTYAVVCDSLANYFALRIYEPIESFTQEHLEEYLRHVKRVQGLSNYTRNNYLSFLGTIFNYFIKKKAIRDSPTKNIEKLPVTISKHKYYDTKTFNAIKAATLEKRPQLHDFLEFIYHTGTRPMAEARKLKAKHVLWERELIFIPGEISKNKVDDYIPMSKGLIQLLKGMGVDACDSNCYIFGNSGKPGKGIGSPNYFQKPFKKIRDDLKLDPDYTIYAMKHTKALHMAQDGANPYDIMKLFRHSGLDMTMKYLRDLGVDLHKVNDKSRKF